MNEKIVSDYRGQMNEKIVSDYRGQAKYLTKQLIVNAFGDSFKEFLNAKYFNSLYKNIYGILVKDFRILEKYKVVDEKILQDLSKRDNTYFDQIKNIYFPEQMRGEEYDMIVWYAIGKEIQNFNRYITTTYLHTYKPKKFAPLSK